MSKQSEISASDLFAAEAIRSPCVAICALDENDICVGCYRSGSEITDWFMADAHGKRDIIAAAARRRREAGSTGLS